MKKQTKDILQDIALVFGAMVFLICGCITIEIGLLGKGIFLIMTSMYTVMWVHAGMTGTIIVKKLENMREQERRRKES